MVLCPPRPSDWDRWTIGSSLVEGVLTHYRGWEVTRALLKHADFWAFWIRIPGGWAWTSEILILSLTLSSCPRVLPWNSGSHLWGPPQFYSLRVQNSLQTLCVSSCRELGRRWEWGAALRRELSILWDFVPPLPGTLWHHAVVLLLSHVRLFVTPMNCSTPGFLVLHYLSEFAQTHVCWVSDAIQLSHSLSPPSPLALNLSQHQSFPVNQLFTSGGQSTGASASASVLPMNIQEWFPLGLTGLISLLSKGLSRVFSSTTKQKHQFFSAQPPLWSNLHIRTWRLEKPQLWLYGPLSSKWSPLFNTMSRFVIVSPRWIIKIQTPSFTHSYGSRGKRIKRGAMILLGARWSLVSLALRSWPNLPLDVNMAVI